MSIKTTKKLIIYTQQECDYCKDTKDFLTENNIEFIDKPINGFEKEWNLIKQTVGIALTPTLVYNNNILIPNRDFDNIEDIPSSLKNCDNNKYEKEYIILERLKTLEYNMMNALEYIYDELDELKK